MRRPTARLLVLALAATGLVAAPAAADTSDIVISEIRIDQPSTDNDEFFELTGPAAQSLDGLTYVVIGDGASALGSGVIEEVTALSGNSIHADGTFVVAESTFTLGARDLTTSLNFENGDNVTHLLVEGFTGSTGDDLDTDDDGTLDVTPWTAVVDGIALVESANPPSGTEWHYGGVAGAAVGPDGSNVPGHVYRDGTGAWQIGDFNGGDESVRAAEPEPGPCEGPFTAIHDIQGAGDVSPIEGDEVRVEAVVTADYRYRGGLTGFFVQEQDDQRDSDPSTSEGIFVYGYWHDVTVGDTVVIDATVEEYEGLTELTDASVAVCDPSGTVSPTAFALPADDTARESVEGMWLSVDAGLTITELYNTGRYGEIWLSATGVLWQPTELFEPYSTEAETLAEENELNRLLLDDGWSWSNLDPNFWLEPADELRLGDTAGAFTGVMHEAHDYYRVQPVDPPTFSEVNDRPEAPVDVGGDVRVASFNVLNYFTTFRERGAYNAWEFERQRTKIIAAIRSLDADVVGLMEIENNGYEDDGAVKDLLAGLNEAEGRDVWHFVKGPGGTLGSDEITNGLIYRKDTVRRVGKVAVLDSSVDERFDDDRNRPVLAASFTTRRGPTPGVFTVAVNHLKSKGSSCGPGDDDPVQGNCNATRTAAAEAEAEWLASNPTGVKDPIGTLVIGDLNSYRMEDPIDAFAAGGFTSVLPSPSYTYVFFGMVGTLDHALADEALAPHVTGATIWHINADEAPALDYKGWNPDDLYAPDAFRSSDHDPVIVGLDLDG